MAGPGDFWNGRSTPTVEVRVLGEIELLVGGVAAGDGLRRSRVRTMLALLALLGTVRRERLADLMWPDLDPTAAAANVRVTLTRVRSLLGPNGGRALIEADSQRVSLAPVDVRIDLCEFDRDVASADLAEQVGDPPAAIDLLERACRRWRAEPFPDLQGIDAVAAEVEHVRRRVTSAALRLATLLCDAGRFDAAARWGERVRDAVPYDERAHRAAIAAHLGRGDRDAAMHTARVTWAMLRELGVQPDCETRVLLRQAGASRLAL